MQKAVILIPKQERLAFLDTAKGIGILFVIISHGCGFPFGGYYLASYYIALFFVISGYLYSQNRTYGQNVIHKVEKLIFPYLKYTLILFLLYVVCGRFDTWKDSVEAILGALYSRYCLFYPANIADNYQFFHIDNTPMWFLTAMFVSCLAFYAVIEWCLKSRKCLAMVIILFLTATIAMQQIPILLPWSLDEMFLGAVFMIVGAILAQQHFFQNTWNGKTVIISIFIFLLYLITAYYNTGVNLSIREYGPYGLLSVILVAILGCTGSISCITISKLAEHTRVGKWLATMGKDTLPLLAFHLFIFAVTDKVFLTGLGLNTNHVVIYWTYEIIKIMEVIICCRIYRLLLEHCKKIKFKGAK